MAAETYTSGWFSSGDIVDIEGDEYSIFVSANGDKIQAKNTVNVDKSFFLNLNGEETVGQTVIRFENTTTLTDPLDPQAQLHQVFLEFDQLSAQMSASMTVSPTTLYATDTLYVDIEIESTGEIDAEDVEFSYTVPAFFTIERVTGCTQSNRIVRITASELEGSRTCELRLIAQQDLEDYVMRATLKFADANEEYSLFVESNEFDVNEPVESTIHFEGETLYLQNRTELNISFENHLDETADATLIFHVPANFVVESSDFTAQPSQIAGMTQYTKDMRVATIRSSALKLRGTILGYAPVYYQTRYSIDGYTKESALQSVYYSINSENQAFDEDTLEPVVGTVEEPFNITIDVSPEDVYTLTNTSIDIQVKNTYTEPVEDVDIFVLFDGVVLAREFYETIPQNSRIRMDLITLYPDYVEQNTRKDVQVRAQYTAGDLSNLQTENKTVLVQKIDPVTISKSITSDSVLVGERVNVTVEGELSREGRTYNVSFTDHVPDGFFVIGQTKRTLIMVGGEKIPIYQYELEALDVPEATSYILTTTVQMDIPSDNGDIRFENNKTVTLTVEPNTPSLSITASKPSPRVGDPFEIDFTITNNASLPVYNITVSPKSTEHLHAVKDEHLIDLLVPDESSTISFTYRALRERSFTHDLLNVAYQYEGSNLIEKTDGKAAFSADESLFTTGPLIYTQKNASDTNYSFFIENKGDAAVQLTLGNTTITLSAGEFYSFLTTENISTLAYTYLSQSYTVDVPVSHYLEAIEVIEQVEANQTQQAQQNQTDNQTTQQPQDSTPSIESEVVQVEPEIQQPAQTKLYVLIAGLVLIGVLAASYIVVKRLKSRSVPTYEPVLSNTADKVAEKLDSFKKPDISDKFEDRLSSVKERMEKLQESLRR